MTPNDHPGLGESLFTGLFLTGLVYLLVARGALPRSDLVGICDLCALQLEQLRGKHPEIQGQIDHALRRLEAIAQVA